jgi:hypothetical protein
MCNLYSITKNQDAVRRLFNVAKDSVGNLASMPGVFPDYEAPVVRNAECGRELIKMRWGMPPPPQYGGAPPYDRCGNRRSCAGRTRCHPQVSKERRQFKKAIAEISEPPIHPSRHGDACRATRSLVYDCAGMADDCFASDADVRAFSAKASMAKHSASDMAMKVTTDAVQIFGGADYTKEFPVERYMRDSKSTRSSRAPARYIA